MNSDLPVIFVGKLGLVDYDEVELSNLHRQVLHTESKVGSAKSQSVADGCRRYVCSCLDIYIVPF